MRSALARVQTSSRDLERWVARHEGPALLAAGTIFMLFVYFCIFTFAQKAPLWRAAIDALGNTLSASAWAAISYWAVNRLVLGRRLWIQASLHFLFALVFSMAWYVTYKSVFAWTGGFVKTNIVIKNFLPVVVSWQLFQGMMLYAAVAGATVALHARRLMKAAEIRADRAEEIMAARAASVPTRLMVRGEDEYLPLEVDEIVAIRGSDDYSEVITVTGRTLVRRSLAKLEADLPRGRFLRVHRSWIVNLDRLVRAEPAGNGRLQLFLSNGDPIIASRTGTRLLRERVV